MSDIVFSVFNITLSLFEPYLELSFNSRNTFNNDEWNTAIGKTIAYSLIFLVSLAGKNVIRIILYKTIIDF